jgi:hypothetical protein
MRALLVSLALLGACDAGAKPEPRPDRDTLQKPPVIIVTKGEITFRDKLEAPDAGALDVVPSCTQVLEQLSKALFAYDPSYVALTVSYRPKVLASCQDDGWTDELKRCILEATPEGLAHDHACEPLITDDLRQKVAKRLGLSTGTGSSAR